MLLLDEPLGALDAKLRRTLQVELKTLQESVGITFLYVTHDQEEALTMSDRLAVMEAGTVAQMGTPMEVYEEPVDAYVADFLGVSNLMDGTADGSRPVAVLVGSRLGGIRTWPPSRGPSECVGPVKVAVRPERVADRALRGDRRQPGAGHGRAAGVPRLLDPGDHAIGARQTDAGPPPEPGRAAGLSAGDGGPGRTCRPTGSGSCPDGGGPVVEDPPLADARGARRCSRWVRRRTPAN